MKAVKIWDVVLFLHLEQSSSIVIKIMKVNQKTVKPSYHMFFHISWKITLSFLILLCIAQESNLNFAVVKGFYFSEIENSTASFV